MYKKHWHSFSGRTQLLDLLLSKAQKSPFVICSKMAAVGNRKHLFVVVWFSSPCSNMLTARGPADRKNIWLLCIAERAHIYYTWRSVHLPKSQPVCSSISANTCGTHSNTVFLWYLHLAKQHKHCITRNFSKLESRWVYTGNVKSEFLSWCVLCVKYWVFQLGKFCEKTDGLPLVLQATPEFCQ